MAGVRLKSLEGRGRQVSCSDGKARGRGASGSASSELGGRGLTVFPEGCMKGEQEGHGESEVPPKRR